MNEDTYKLQKNLQYQPASSSALGSNQLSLRPQPRSSDYHFSMRLLATDRLFQRVKAHRAGNLALALKQIRVHAEVRQQQ